ncbi:MAG: DUF87 domain-containing protein [Nanoarchaeota archaeon]|nr:DUF87 domain-containing protein [Nanoarchaeota archaeon]
MNEIVIGREAASKLGTQGRILLGKHYVKMGQVTSLSNPVYLDVSTSHVVLIVGKRGGGKSYTMGVMAEGMADLPKEVSENLSVIILDTMGVYWTMKYPNMQDKVLLNEWGLKPKGLDVQIYTPVAYYKKYKEEGVPTDFPFSIKPSEVGGVEWCETFGVKETDPVGVLIESVISTLKEKGEYSMDDILATIRASGEEKIIVDAAQNLFTFAKSWGLFHEKGTPIRELAQGGKVTIVDVSCYATLEDGWKIKAMVVGLLSMKLFEQRMKERKEEEYANIHETTQFGAKEEKQKMPLVWLVIDEAHEFLPNKGSTLASFPLITILREGRQPGISLVLATQQPGKISVDAMTQADTVIAHRVTAKIDTDALGTLMQSYMREGLTEQLDNLPRLKGSAIIFDDTNEKMYAMRMRPRLTWHGGSSPSAVHVKKKLFGLE